MTLPPNQQLIRGDRWPVVGEKAPCDDDSEWSITVEGAVMRPAIFPLNDLIDGKFFPIVDKKIDIHCVTRWSKLQVHFRGIELHHFLRASQPRADARFLLLEARSDRRHSTSIPISLATNSLVAFEANGDSLAQEHGGPVRVVVPDRYFYKSLKWLERIVVLQSDELGFWEATAGYHNEADPWKEQRYVASNLSKREAAELISTRSFRARTLRGIDCRGRNLDGLDARQADLRNASFQGASLHGADFSGSNLSNARFAGASLRGANFENADVEGADFSGADLRGANLQVKSLFGATFFDPNSNEQSRQTAVFDQSTQFDNGQLKNLSDEQREYLEEYFAMDLNRDNVNQDDHP